MTEIILCVAAWSLQFAFVMGVALASRWILRFFVSSEAVRPHAWSMAGIWLVGLVVIHAYWGYTEWLQGRLVEQYSSLQGKIRMEAKQAAESQGEIVPPDQPLAPDAKLHPPKNFPQPGPIYNTEYWVRTQKAYEQLYNQSGLPDIKSAVVEWLLLVLWFACALTVAGYCFAVLRKSSGWLKASALALAVALVQCFVLGIPTVILTVVFADEIRV